MTHTLNMFIKEKKINLLEPKISKIMKKNIKNRKKKGIEYTQRENINDLKEITTEVS